VARLGATILLSGFLGTVAITVATATDDPPPTTPTVRAPAPGGHHRVRWQLYLREHHATTQLGARAPPTRPPARAPAAVRACPPRAGGRSGALQEWLCIHRYEGAWDANTGNGYYGGLQMDKEFQQAYGPELLQAKGTADHWTPLEQMQVAERAYQSGRGFYPWPNTARMCGLI
jgi:hypothetical protein